MMLTAETLIKKSLNLASAPHIYQCLTTLIAEPDSTFNDITTVIQTDPALTARVLRIVNSACYGFPSQINTLPRAIAIIGTDNLLQLVLATSVIDAFKGIPSSLIDMNTFWRHSCACAITSQLLAKACGQHDTEQFFIAGLLHNIGSLVLYLSVPELAREAIYRSMTGHEILFKAEQRVFGFNHTHVGEALARNWRLPESFIAVARFHHSPSEATSHHLEVAIVHVADILVSSIPFGHAGDNHVPPLDPQAWQSLALDEKQVPLLLKQVAAQIDEFSAAMMFKH